MASGLIKPIRSSSVGATSARRPSRELNLRFAVDDDDRHVERRVRGVRLAGFGIAHHLDIAVIGGDEQHAARLLDGRAQPAQAGVDRLARP